LTGQILAKVEPGTKMAAIVGPTAAGKTAVAVRIAQQLNAEIVSVDAMQVYRGMDIGTGKAACDELSPVPCHMLDIADVTDSFSVARFKELADDAAFQVAARGKVPLLVGGSGLYYRAVVDDLDFPNTGGTDQWRVEIVEELGEMDDIELHDLLVDLDPASAREIPAQNRKRVLRAIEVARQADRLMSERQHGWRDFESPYGVVAAGLEMNRHELYKLIDERVDRMMEAGLEKEVIDLKARGLARGTTAGEAIGYRQILEHLDGQKTLEEAVEEIKRRTRNYSKRQMTWFKADPRIKWFEVGLKRGEEKVDLGGALESVSRDILAYIEEYLEN
jgi:tRNA dimethylallyltransferase